VWLNGIVGIQKEIVLAARQSIVTVEEVVDRVDESHGGVVIPRWVINAVCLVPRGAFPSYADGYYNRSNRFYIRWNEISRDRQTFLDWMDAFVLATRDHAEFMAKLEEGNYV